MTTTVDIARVALGAPALQQVFVVSRPECLLIKSWARNARSNTEDAAALIGKLFRDCDDALTAVGGTKDARTLMVESSDRVVVVSRVAEDMAAAFVFEQSAPLGLIRVQARQLTAQLARTLANDPARASRAEAARATEIPNPPTAASGPLKTSGGTPLPGTAVPGPAVPLPGSGTPLPGTPVPSAGTPLPGKPIPSAGTPLPGKPIPSAGAPLPGKPIPSAGTPLPGTPQSKAGTPLPGTPQPSGATGRPPAGTPLPGAPVPGQNGRSSIGERSPAFGVPAAPGSERSPAFGVPVVSPLSERSPAFGVPTAQPAEASHDEPGGRFDQIAARISGFMQSAHDARSALLRLSLRTGLPMELLERPSSLSSPQAELVVRALDELQKKPT